MEDRASPTYVKYVPSGRPRARARGPAVWGGALGTRVFRLEPTRELGRGLLMHGARLLPLCYRPRMMMRCHTDESLNLVLAIVEWLVINHQLEATVTRSATKYISVCNLQNLGPVTCL